MRGKRESLSSIVPVSDLGPKLPRALLNPGEACSKQW